MKNVTIELYCNCENKILSTFTTNCPIEDVKHISGLIQDANINLSDGDEVNKFINIVQALGYDIYCVEPVRISI